jgi:hypothetical protein
MFAGVGFEREMFAGVGFEREMFAGVGFEREMFARARAAAWMRRGPFGLRGGGTQ